MNKGVSLIMGQKNKTLSSYEEIAKNNPELDEVEQLELICKIRNGDSSAKDKLLYSCVGMIIDYASKKCSSSEQMDDVLQSGIGGIIDAIDRYDSTKGTKFSTYAYFWMKKRMLEQIRVSQPVDIPEELCLINHKVEEAEELFYVEHGRKPSVKELAVLLNKSENDVYDAQKSRHPVTYLNDFISEEGEDEIVDQTSDDSAISTYDRIVVEAKNKELSEMYGHLREEEKKVIDLLFGLDGGKSRDFKEISKIMNISEYRVYQLYMKAKKEMSYEKRSQNIRQLER